MSLLVLEACTATCRAHLSRTWLIMQKSAQSVEMSQTFENGCRIIAHLYWQRLIWQSKHGHIIISLWPSVKVTAYFSTVGHANSFCRLATCRRFVAAVLWVSGTAWSVEPQKCFSRTEIMTSRLRSCFAFYFLSKIWHQPSSVSSQPCKWRRNAGQRRRQMSVLQRFVFLLSAGCCRLVLDCDWIFRCRDTTRSNVSKFRQYSSLFFHAEEIISLLLLDLVVYLQTLNDYDNGLC